MIHLFKPDAQGHIFIDGNKTKFSNGDTILISGNPKDVLVSNVIGTDYINISNDPAGKTTIGDPGWAGGSYSYGLMFKNCKFINLFGAQPGALVLTGSVSAKLDANGFGVRGAYFNLRIDELSDNFKVHDLSIKGGGTGVWCKTEVTSNSKTWWPNYLENFEFYNLDIRDTYVEAMYIGHTAPYWNIKSNQPYYPTGPKDQTAADTTTYKQPAKLRNVIIHNCFVSGSGFDGIQTAAIENLQVHDNEVTNWAVSKNSGHNGGILIGGRVKNFMAYNNYIHDGFGEAMQVYAEGGAAALIKNNLIVAPGMEGVSVRGTAGLAVEFSNNTVIKPNGTTFRVNGYYGGTGSNVVKNNILVQPTGVSGVIYPNRYIYLENGGLATDEGNIKIPTLADAKLDAANYYAPLPDSKGIGYGYVRHAEPQEPPADIPAVVTVSSDLLAGLIKSIAPGDYSVGFEIKDGEDVKKINAKITIS